jgi:hypothetical protein
VRYQLTAMTVYLTPALVRGGGICRAQCGGTKRRAGCWRRYSKTGLNPRMKLVSPVVEIAVVDLAGCSKGGPLADFAESL